MARVRAGLPPVYWSMSGSISTSMNSNKNTTTTKITFFVVFSPMANQPENILPKNNTTKEFQLIINKFGKEIVEQVEIQLKYEVYIDKQQQMAQKLELMEDLKIISNFNHTKISALSSEARQKLSSIKPKTIGQPSRISGVSPADVSVLMVYLGR